jgi:hypothetical protein
MGHKVLYCQSVDWSKVCRDRFGTECRAVSTQQQDRPRTCNVTLMRVPVTINAVEKQFELHTLCMYLQL